MKSHSVIFFLSHEVQIIIVRDMPHFIIKQNDLHHLIQEHELHLYRYIL